MYETNVASCRIWDALGFKRIGRIPACGNLRSSPEGLVEAIVYGRSLGSDAEDIVSEERFDKIRYYLKNGTYPSGADRAEKSRLRSAATHYKLVKEDDNEGGEEKLMLKDKEVVSDPQRQYQISKQVHAQQHGGINKTTATIAERFHWVRIKETVSLVIKNCPDCKETAAKAPTVRPTGESSSQFKKANSAHGQNRSNNDPNSMIERLVNFDQQPDHPHTAHGSSTRGRKFSISTSPPEIEMDHQAPTAMMRRLQEFNGIPVDPQIDPRIIQQPHHGGSGSGSGNHHHHHHHYNSSSSNDTYGAPPPSHRVENRYMNDDDDNDAEMDDGSSSHQHQQQQQHLSMAMATERHVRKGDEPTGYQTGGLAHDEDPDETDDDFKNEHDGDDDDDDGEEKNVNDTEREMDFQELLGNS